MVQTAPRIDVSRASVRGRGHRGFLVYGTIDGLAFHGVVDFAARGGGRVLELSTDFAPRAGCRPDLDRVLIAAAADRARVTL